ncbi:helix-turn-helix domain-containing protein, partial [Chloroflexota bacterium]
MSERQHLEFKVTLNHQDESDRLELLRDIVSFANGGGGYLIIGIRDDGEGHAQKYEPDMIGDRQKIKRAITSLCLDHIRDRIDGLEIRLRTVRSYPLVIVRIPTSIRIPHMVTFQNHTDFFTRYEDGKREMTLSEIREAFNQDLIARRLSSIETQLQTIRSTQPAQPLKEKDIQDGIVPRFLRIEDGDTLADETSNRFIVEVGDQPFFRVSITPTFLKAGLIDVDSEPMRNLVNNPPGSRRAGWNMRAGYHRIERFADGIRQGDRSEQYLELLG